MDLVSSDQFLGEAVCLSLYANAFGKGMNPSRYGIYPSLLPGAMGKIVRHIKLFNFSIETSLKGKLLI